MQVKRESQQNQSRWRILVSRCRVRDPTVLASTASDSPGKTKSESQKVPLSSLNVQKTSTGRPVILSSSPNSSEWNNDDKWSSQVGKSGEMSGTSAGRPVSNKLVIDIDMDSDTTTESDLSLKSRSFLNRVKDRLQKMLNRSPEKIQCRDIDKRSMIWRMLMSSTLEASVFMGKDYSDTLDSIKNTEDNLTFKKMFEISEQLIRMRFLECLWSAGKVLHGNSYLWSMMKKSSVSRMQRFMCSQILCFVLERWIRTQHQILFGSDRRDGSKIHHSTELWTQLMVSQWNSSEIFSQDFHRIPRIRVDKVQEFLSKMSDQPEFKGRIIFMSMFNDIFMGISRQWTGMRI